MNNSLGHCRIDTQGVIIVNSCSIYKRTKDIVLIEIDCKSKYPYIDFHISDSDGICGIGLSASENTLHKDETKEGITTIVTFPEFKNYIVFATYVGRYTVNICLCKI